MATSATYRVHEAYSLARRSGDHVHLVLRLPGVVLERGTEPTLELTRRSKKVTARAQVASTTDATTLTADPPAAALGPGVWRLALRLPGEDGRRRLEARLLLPRRGPIALLAGPTPGASLRPRPHGGTVVARAARTVRKATDVALRELPPERAVRYRRALQRVARRIRNVTANAQPRASSVRPVLRNRSRT